MEEQLNQPELIIVDSYPKPPKLYTAAASALSAAIPVIVILPHGEVAIIISGLSVVCVAVYSFFNRFNQL